MSNWHDRRFTDAHWDHERDLRKHEPRASDPLPHRLSPPIAGALEVAILVKGIASYTDAAALIEQYAQTVAAEARLQAVVDTADRVFATIEASNAQA